MFINRKKSKTKNIYFNIPVNNDSHCNSMQSLSQHNLPNLHQLRFGKKKALLKVFSHILIPKLI